MIREISGVTREFEGLRALAGVSMTVQPLARFLLRIEPELGTTMLRVGPDVALRGALVAEAYRGRAFVQAKGAR